MTWLNKFTIARTATYAREALFILQTWMVLLYYYVPLAPIVTRTTYHPVVLVQLLLLSFPAQLTITILLKDKLGAYLV